MFTAPQDTPITVDLLEVAKSTGWSFDGNIATHDSCNSGYATLLNYPLIVGHTYQVSYSVLTITSGAVQLFAGDTPGVSRTATGLYVETITTSGVNPVLRYYSNGNCSIQEFNIRDTITNTNPKQQNTICYSALTKKWSDFRTFSPDCGFSLFIHTYTLYQGNMWEHANNSESRNNFYGVQYKSILKFVENKDATIVKTYEKLTYQANSLLVTTTDGITTSLGQVSQLDDADFLQYALDDGVTGISVYTIDGLYSSVFKRDTANGGDINEGDELKGNYLITELTQVDGSIALILFTVDVKSAKSFNNLR